MSGAKRRRRIVGLVPWLARALWDGTVWTVRHPQPALLAGVLIAAAWGIWRYAQRADAFRIAYVELPSQSSLTLPNSLVGTNLWELNIGSLAAELKHQQPWLKDVRVIRLLPNAVRIEAIPRLPIGQVRLDRWYPVDRDGFILPQGSPEPAQRLIRIAGCERSAALKPGRGQPDERLRLALRVLGALRRSPALLSRRVMEINVADADGLRFVIDDGTEVRCGSEAELATHLKRLQETLRAITRQHLAVQYIDLRYGEPVVGPRT